MSALRFDLKAHQEKYPLKLGGLPLKEYFEHKKLREQREQNELVQADHSSPD